MKSITNGEAWYVCLALLDSADKPLTRDELSQRMALHQAFLSQRWGKPLDGAGFMVSQTGMVQSDFLVATEEDAAKWANWCAWVNEHNGALTLTAAGRDAISRDTPCDPLALGGYACDAGSGLVEEISNFYRMETAKTSRQVTRLIRQALGLPRYLHPGHYNWQDILTLSDKEPCWRDYVVSQVVTRSTVMLGKAG